MSFIWGQLQQLGMVSIIMICAVGGIVEKSIQILRSHGKNDTEIREMMSKDFSINEKELNRMLQK